jgi:hypothetical protein
MLMQPPSNASSMPPPEHQWYTLVDKLGIRGTLSPGLRGRWNRGSWVVCMGGGGGAGGRREGRPHAAIKCRLLHATP